MADHIVQVGLYLGGIVLLILACGYLAKKVGRTGFQTSGSMRVVASLSLGIKEKLLLVQIGDQRQILLGVSPERIERIDVYSEPVIACETEGFGDFKAKLQGIMKDAKHG